MRISDAARSLGMTSVSVCAPEDVCSPHVLHADEHVVLRGERGGGGGGAIGPYLDIEGLTDACVEGGVDYVHPGEWCEVHDGEVGGYSQCIDPFSFRPLLSAAMKFASCE